MGFCDDIAFSRRRRQKYKASFYVAESWGFHIRKAEPGAAGQEAVLAFLASDNKRSSMLQIQEYVRNGRSDVPFVKSRTLLHVIAQEGLTTICKQVLERRINGSDRYLPLATPTRR